MPKSAGKKYAYDQAYLKQNVRSVVIPFNRRNPEDMRKLDWLNSRKEGKTACLKRLIEQAMEKGGK